MKDDLIIKSPDSSEDLIIAKHDEYSRKARAYKFISYSTRLILCISSLLLPLFTDHEIVTKCFSITVVLMITIEMVFMPIDKYKLFSNATDFLALEKLKRTNDYKKYESELNIILTTENKEFEKILKIDAFLKDLKKQGAKSV